MSLGGQGERSRERSSVLHLLTDLGLIQWVDYEIGSGTYVPWDDPDFGSYDFWGASARSIDGAIERLVAPVLLQSSC